MYEVTLYQIESAHKNLRTKTVKGIAPELPHQGRRFFMYTEALETKEEGFQRYVLTSEVSEIKDLWQGRMVFKTENSLYEVIYERAKVQSSAD